MNKNLLVFCGSRLGVKPSFALAAEQLAEEMSKQNLNLVYGGGKVGIMGCIADACLKNDLQVTGVIPEMLMEKELAHPDIQNLIVVPSMHARKQKMFELSHAVLALAGGIGTLDEWFEMLTWAQLKVHSLPMILVNTEGYYDALLNFLDNCVSQGFLDQEVLDKIQVVDSISSISW